MINNRIIYLLVASVFTNMAFAQIQFEEIPQPGPSVPFVGVKLGSIAFSDVDGDTDMDLLITGRNQSNDGVTELYLNDGTGHYSKVDETPFIDVSSSAIAFADIDGDNDEDVLITGRTNLNQETTRLYLNDGAGIFTELLETPFEQVERGSVVFSDLNGDDSPDVLITGNNSSNTIIAKLYFNDGSGVFTEALETPFTGVLDSSIALADVNGDDNLDVLITGKDDLETQIAKLYTNDGSGNFTEVVETSFEGVDRSSVAFSDIDGDEDMDLMITGRNSANQKTATLYQNDGDGNFTVLEETIFEAFSHGVEYCSIAFIDIDNDDDADLIISGHRFGTQLVRLYENNGDGVFTELTETPFYGVLFSSLAFADVDGDTDQDVFITGETSYGYKSSKLYKNDGSGGFTSFVENFINPSEDGSMAFSDVDGDGDQDVFITGRNDFNESIAKLYTNNGEGLYTEVNETTFEAVYNSEVVFADIDNDDDDDLLITGRAGTNQPVAKLYENDGDGNFTEILETPFGGVYYSGADFADVNGDEFLDVMIIGFNNTSTTAHLYINDGTGSFTEQLETPFEGVQNGSIAFADVDGDEDQDVLITGTGSTTITAKLYLNDGSANFTELEGTIFDPVKHSSIAFADIDGDEDQDLLMTGFNNSFQRITKLYQNDGGTVFTEIEAPFDDVYNSSIAFADVDNDDDQDVLITGLGLGEIKISKIYKNNGAGGFIEVIGTPFDGVAFGSAAFADVDNDGKKDVFITGENTVGERISKVYRNASCVPVTGIATEMACNSFTWIDGIEYTESNTTAMYTLEAESGCDSIVTLNLTINYSSTGTDIQTACDSYTWIDGVEYTESNTTATHTLTNAVDCDSLVTLNLTINYSNTGTDVQEACDTYTWIDGITYTESNTTATHTLTNAADCDSLVTLNLTMNYSNSGTDVQEACDTYTWIDGVEYTESNTTATHSLLNTSGCDSLVTLNLTMNYSNTGTDVQTACDTYTWIDGIEYTESTSTATHLLVNAVGCDSLVTLDLTINNSDNETDVQEACDSYTWIDGNEYTSSNNTATFTLNNVSGCDSIITLDLTINSIDTGVEISGGILVANEAGATYQWLDCSTFNTPIVGATSQSFTPDVNGMYAVEITEGDCSVTTDCFTIANVGIQETFIQEQVNIYPNPNAGIVNIDLGELSGVEITVTNVIGQVLYYWDEINHSEFQFELNQKPGFYIIDMNYQGSHYKYKLTKN